MRRRDFVTLIVGAATGWPLAARAQQAERMRRIGALMLYPEADPEGQLRAEAFRQELARLGWTAGRTLHLDFYWGLGDAAWVRSALMQMLQLTPDVILANGDATAVAVQQLTRTVPVVFIGGSDTVAEGLVQSLARPGGNMTGFSVFEPTLGAKLLELLKEIAPQVTRVGVVFNPDNLGNREVVDVAVTAAPRFAIEAVAVPLRNSGETEAALAQWGREPHDGLIVLPDPSTNAQRKLIEELAARRRLPAIHALRAATAEGGLMSYGVDLPDLFRKAAGYADRILRGDKPADLPVQLPTKFELVINLKTARALGLKVPLTLQYAADEVIE